MSEIARNRCPVCRAAFRGGRECSRCGADLAPLMGLVAEAHRCRAEARRALTRRDYGEAFKWAGRAEELCHSDAGRRLWLLTRWLAQGRPEFRHTS